MYAGYGINFSVSNEVQTSAAEYLNTGTKAFTTRENVEANSISKTKVFIFFILAMKGYWQVSS